VLVALAISHGVSFAVNFLGAREWETTTVRELMTIPYRRIVVMHLTVIFGGFLVLLIDRQLPALVLLVLLKIAADLHGHVRERTRTRAAVSSAAVLSRAA
jgi:hydrogenase/urease accessory protein HupE